jgi:hypothetical protein
LWPPSTWPCPGIETKRGNIRTQTGNIQTQTGNIQTNTWKFRYKQGTFKHKQGTFRQFALCGHRRFGPSGRVQVLRLGAPMIIMIIIIIIVIMIMKIWCPSTAHIPRLLIRIRQRDSSVLCCRLPFSYAQEVSRTPPVIFHTQLSFTMLI